MKIVWIAALVLLGMGCELGADGSSAPVEVCQGAGMRCKLGGGKLGVCQADLARQGQWICASQH